MSITTVLPMPREYTCSSLMQDVMTTLRRQPEVPLSLGVIADSIAGITVAQVERAVKNLEGPVPGREEDAYIHFCRVNYEAVYIP